MLSRLLPSTRAALVLAGLFGALTACAAQGPVRAQRPWQSLDLQLALRNYDDLDPVEDQTPIGLEYSSERPGDAFGWGIGFTWAQQDGSLTQDSGELEVDSDVYEVYAGLRRGFDTSSAVRPYLGLGLTLINVEADVSGPAGSSTESDTATGFYLRGGLRFDVSRSFHVALDARSVFGASLDFDVEGGDADHDQLAFVVGFAF